MFGATTNMPSGAAVKPGDVVISHLGKSIEIINTDAEGRLVLADVLSYARRFKPAAVIDAATLTGACVIALGHVATGVLGSDQGLIDEVLTAAKRAAEPGWQLPLWDEYKELIKSDVADIKNTGGRAGGTITAAMFLKEFAEEYPWVHLDIAGTAYSESDLVAIPRGPTGVTDRHVRRVRAGEGGLTGSLRRRRSTRASHRPRPPGRGRFAREARRRRSRRGTPRETRARYGARRSPLPADSAAADSARARQRADSIRAAALARRSADSIKAPLAHAEVPPLTDIGERYRWGPG